MGDMEKDTALNLSWWQWLLLGIVLVVLAGSVLRLHFDYSGPYRDPWVGGDVIIGNHAQYPFPYHADEWIHLAYATFLINEHKITPINPYVQTAKHVNIEQGVATYAAVFFTLAGIDPLFSNQYLPAITIIIVGLALFFLTLLITKKFFIAILMPLFLILIKSDNLLLGFWFFVPVTFGLIFILLAFATYIRGGRARWLTLLFFIVSLFTYPLASIIIAIGVVIVTLQEIMQNSHYKKMIRTHFSKILFYGIIGIIILFVAVIVVFHGQLSKFPLIINYGAQTGSIATDYNLLSAYGILLLTLAVIGGYYSFKKNYTYSILLICLCVALFAQVIIYAIFTFSFMIPVARAFFYLLVFLMPLSATGVYACYAWVKGKQHHTTVRGVIAIILFILILGVIFATRLPLATPSNPLQTPLQLTSMKDYYALLWVRNHYPPNTMMMVDSITVPASYPVAYVQVPSLPFSAAGAGDMRAISEFYNPGASCTTRKSVLERQNPKPLLVYASMRKISCPFLKEIYNKERYVYEVDYTSQ